MRRRKPIWCSKGGGVKGIGLVGAYSVLKEAGYTFHRIAGTSAGSVVGAMVAADIPMAELKRIMREVDYRKFQDEGLLDRLGPLGIGASLLFEKGIYEGDYLRTWLDEILTRHGKRTFADLRIDDPTLPPERAYRLVVMVADVTRGTLVRLPWDYPDYGLDPDDQLVADAVRASMSIPLFFEPVHQKAVAKDGTVTPCLWVDGGMLSNFPTDVFDPAAGKPVRPTIGVKLSAEPDSSQLQRFATDGIVDFGIAMVGTMMSWHDQMHINDPAVQARTIFVDTSGVRPTDFGLDAATQQKLYLNGRKAARKFLKT